MRMGDVIFAAGRSAGDRRPGRSVCRVHDAWRVGPLPRRPRLAASCHTRRQPFSAALAMTAILRRCFRLSCAQGEAGAERPPRPAATLVVVRDGAAGIEVLLSRRAERGDHNSGAWVFPGGIVEKADALAHAACAGLDDAEASRRLGLAQGGLDYYVAAIRECFEESGLLFARGRGSALVDLDGSDAARLGAVARRAPSRRARHGRVLRRRRPDPGGRSAGLSQPLADAARPPEALRHALLRRRGARRADRGARRRRAARAALDRARRRARAQRFAQVADADAEDARDAGPLRRRRRAHGVGRGAARGRAGDAARRQRPRGLSPGACPTSRPGASSAASIRPGTATAGTTCSPAARCASRRA